MRIEFTERPDRKIPRQQRAVGGEHARTLYRRLKRFRFIQGRAFIPPSLRRAVEMYGFYAHRRLEVLHEPGLPNWPRTMYPAWLVVQWVRQPLFQMVHPEWGALSSVEDVPHVFVIFSQRTAQEPPPVNEVLDLLWRADLQNRPGKEAHEDETLRQEKALRDLEKEEEDLNGEMARDLASAFGLHEYVPVNFPSKGAQA